MKRESSKTLIVGFFVILSGVVVITAGCKSKTDSKQDTKSKLSGSVRVGGSTTVLPIAQAAAEQFQAKNPDVKVEVQGTGSSEGIKGVTEGTLDIGDSSRELKPKEKSLGLVDHAVAIDVIAFAVHPSNKVKNLTPDQIKGILTGKIGNWKEVGGLDEKIQVVGRDEASGTREYVQKEVIGKDAKFVQDALALPGTGQLKAAVAQTPFAFGYMSIGQVDDTVRAVKVDGVAPTPKSVESKDYKYQRNLHMFTKGEAKGATKAFIDFVLSKEFQSGTLSKEFYPITK